MRVRQRQGSESNYYARCRSVPSQTSSNALTDCAVPVFCRTVVRRAPRGNAGDSKFRTEVHPNGSANAAIRTHCDIIGARNASPAGRDGGHGRQPPQIAFHRAECISTQATTHTRITRVGPKQTRLMTRFERVLQCRVGKVGPRRPAFLSAVAESEGFEPPIRCRIPDFESGAFDHSANSPRELDCISAVAGTHAWPGLRKRRKSIRRSCHGAREFAHRGPR